MPALKMSIALAFFVVAAHPVSAAEGLSGDPKAPRWKSYADDAYLQEVGAKVPTESPITDVAYAGETLFALSGGVVYQLDADRLSKVVGAPAGVARLWGFGDALWASGPDGSHRMTGGAWVKSFDQAFADMAAHLGEIHGATQGEIYRLIDDAWENIKPESGYLSTDTTLIMEDGSQVISDPVRIGPIRKIASYSGTLYVLGQGRLGLLDGAVFSRDPFDWGALPSPRTRDMVSMGSRLYVGTDRGIGVLRGMALTTLDGKSGLPIRDTTCLAPGFAGDLWIGTTDGAIRQVEGEYHYFGGQQWLPGNRVNDIAVGDGSVYIATDAGLGVIRYEPYSLAKKAAFFERQLEAWGHKRLGFVHKLYWAGEEVGWLREISDNDGGHTAHYLAAMSFKYAATKDPQARLNALDAFEAMVWLDEITPKDGFIARAIWAEGVDQGHRAERGSGGLPAKWYGSEDGLWSWKGDTSSDEVNAHFYSVSLFNELVARGDEKDRASRHLARIARHIIDNGWVLRDMDGAPTRWGRWDPEYILRPYGYEARGLNGMEAQTYMWTAYALTGDETFQRGLQQLIDWRYHTFTVRQKLTFPPDAVVPWDDELAFRCYYPLLTYADDPYLRSIYLRSLERHWEVMRRQKVPFFNFVYGALTGNDCEVDVAARHLREWSLDPVSYSYRNSQREDLAPEPGYVAYGKGTRAMSPRETSPMWGSRSSVEYDGGSGGRVVTPAVGWLEDYWMGRHHGFILPPETANGNLPQASVATGPGRGAKPYDGPPRPSGLITNQ